MADHAGRVVRRAVVIVTCTATAALAGCGGSGHHETPGLGVPLPSHSSAVNVGTLHAATLSVAAGTTDLSITVADLHGQLAEATTPVGASQLPVLSISTDVASLALNSAGGSGPAQVNVVLASSVAWTIDLDGGATTETVNTTGGDLVLLDLGAGATDVTVVVSAVAGTQTIQESGGATALTVSAPESVATNVHVTGGASTVQIGSSTHSGVGGDQTFESTGYATAAQKLDVDLDGGVSTVHID